MADEVPAGAWSESASSRVTWGLLLTGLCWGGRQSDALGAPGAQHCLPAPTSAQGASWSPVLRWQASFCSPLVLFNLPASLCCSPLGAFSPRYLSPCLSPLLPPHLWDQAGQLLPSAAVSSCRRESWYRHLCPHGGETAGRCTGFRLLHPCRSPSCIMGPP